MQAHIVPRFHLGRFATPPGRDGFVCSIDKRGRSTRTNVKEACTAEDFYVIENDAGEPSAVLEDMLQKIESYAARRIARLVAGGGEPNDNDRYTLAMYLALAYLRTPQMREQIRWLTDTTTLAHFRSTLDADPPWQRMRAAVFADKTDEEAEELRREMLRLIDEGTFETTFPERKYVISTMETATDLAEVAASMSWAVLRAPESSEFVVGDRAVTLYDPMLHGAPKERGNALRSSPYAETVLPLDRKVAVRLTIDEWSWRDEETTADVVDELNLRSYAWASEEIYGSSQALVVGVRELARRSPPLMIRLAPRRPGVVIDNDYPIVGGGHRRDLVVATPTHTRRTE